MRLACFRPSNEQTSLCNISKSLVLSIILLPCLLRGGAGGGVSPPRAQPLVIHVIYRQEVIFHNRNIVHGGEFSSACANVLTNVYNSFVFTLLCNVVELTRVI